MSEYFSLVAKSGQVNTPPGSYKTIKEWIHNSFLGPHSEVLEVGCSTGFITIEIARYVMATCCGFDLHQPSLDTAKSNADKDIAGRVSFIQGDGGKLPFTNGKFSHTVVGGHLPFVPPQVRRQHITEAVRTIRPWGYLLTALYYYKAPPPQSLLSQFNAEVGTQLQAENDYSYWSNLFEKQRLQLEYESIHDIVPADSERMHQYLDQLKEGSRAEWVKRLQLFNENGKYLQYFVRVYRRLPESNNLMIQIPRGGIYRTEQVSVKYN